VTLSFPIVPMKAVPGLLPPPAEDGDWAYEVKWDGMRVVAFVAADGSVRLQSALPREVTGTFPELAALAEATGGRPAVLDGEVVAVDEAGRPSFGRLQRRLGVTDRREAERRAVEVPVAFQVFDLLSFAGHDAVTLPYLDRRRLLVEVVTPGPAWQVPDHRVGGGAALLAGVERLGLEGVMAKRPDSPYLIGRRSASWRKIKVRNRQEFVVGGWTSGQGRRAGLPGALLVGVPVPGGRLRYAGRVGSGFTDTELGLLRDVLAPLARPGSPFDGPVPRPARRSASGPASVEPASPEPVWVEPVLVVEVASAEWTADGVLRHPVYLGRRTDKDPADVVDERPR
jgi:bifunctional non-homologous end joining protein LigD